MRYSELLISGLLVGFVAACGSGGGGGGTGTTVSGTVTAPSTFVAYNTPTILERFASSIFGSSAYAAISGTVAANGATIELIEVDAAGAKVGATLETTTTDASGAYSFQTTLVAGSKYIIRATGTTEVLDVRYTAVTNDIDPVSTAVSDLVTSTTSDLSTMSKAEIDEIKSAVDGIVENVEPGTLDSAALTTAIKTEITNNEAISNQIASSVAAESICGNVKDASGVNLENIKIVVRDFGNWVTRAKTKTDSSGDYCVNVPANDYILGAINYTGTSTAASEWWSTSGTKYSQIDAEKITVATSASVTKNFALEAGARIEGTVTAGTGGALTTGAGIPGLQVTIRQFQNFFPLAGKRTNANGFYRVNVIPGDYQVEAINKTRFNYGSEINDGSTGTSARFKAAKVTLTAGLANKTTLDFTLDKGYKVGGQILDNSIGGNPVTGLRVKVNNTGGSGPSFRLRTNKDGRYRVWLQPAIYSVESYGSKNGSVDLTAQNQNVSVATSVAKLNVTINDTSGNGVSQAKVFLTDNAGASVTQEVTSSNGTATLYSPTTQNHILYIRIDENHTYATSVWQDKTELLSGTLVALTVGSTTTHPAINLPAAGLLSVNITSDGTIPVINRGATLKDNGSKFIAHRTLSNGNFILSVPAGTTYSVGMKKADNTGVNCPIIITAGQTTTLNFRTDTGACS